MTSTILHAHEPQGSVSIFPRNHDILVTDSVGVQGRVLDAIQTDAHRSCPEAFCGHCMPGVSVRVKDDLDLGRRHATALAVTVKPIMIQTYRICPLPTATNSGCSSRCCIVRNRYLYFRGYCFPAARRSGHPPSAACDHPEMNLAYRVRS